MTTILHSVRSQFALEVGVVAMATKRLKPKFGVLSPVGLEFIHAEGLREDPADRIFGDRSPTFHASLIKRWLQYVFSLFVVRCSILDSQVVSVSTRLLRISSDLNAINMSPLSFSVWDTELGLHGG